MKKKILSTLLAGAAVATMGVSFAQAGSLDSVSGPISFQFDGFDGAQTAYAGLGSICTDIGTCDAASAPTPNAPGSNQNNDTYGYAFVSSITQTGVTPNPWNAGEGDDFLFVYFHGFQDSRVDRASVGSSTLTAVESQGGYADIYRLDSAMLSTLFTLGDINLDNQADIQSAITGWGITAYLNLEFIPSCGTGGLATLCGTFDNAILQGQSGGNAMAIGGDAQTKYPNAFNFVNNVEPCDLTTACPTGSLFNTVLRASSANTVALPEPGALGLLGMGLVGMGLLGRRRKA